ncbi:hypothetical protein GGR50DRAFT_692476 [Xylaria sp. CBS 124048]|nr:hypothetical protein GGR50DRAFT_692476 [Xylaria sp. CBS 124048]
MATHTGAATEPLLDLTITSLSPPEPDLQRGRKRRRDHFQMVSGRVASPLGESASFRGRCRYRSSSRYMDMSSVSRPTSQHHVLIGDFHHRKTSGSLSPSRRKMIRIMQLVGNRQRNQSPPRSPSPYTSYTDLEAAQDTPKRRRQGTRSRSRAHTSKPVGFGMTSHGSDDVNIEAMEAVMLPFTAYQTATSDEPSTRESLEL